MLRMEVIDFTVKNIEDTEAVFNESKRGDTNGR